MSLAKNIAKKALSTTVIDYTGKSESNSVALTFDDGPLPGKTDVVLDILEDAKAVGTFFIIGKRAARDTELLKRAYGLGCEIGNHTWSHADIREMSIMNIRSEIDRADQIIERITGLRENPFRSPYGYLSSRLLYELWRNKRRNILWSRSLGGDEMNSGLPVAKIQEQIRDNPLKAGEIILMHDTNQNIISLLKWLITHIDNQGLKLSTVSCLLSNGIKSQGRIL